MVYEDSPSSSESERNGPFNYYLANGNNKILVNGDTFTADKKLPNTKNNEKSRDSKSNNRRKRNADNRFECDKCAYTTKYRDLGRHMKIHEEARFSCDECNMPFKTLGHLNRHKKSAHGIKCEGENRVYKCTECDYTTRHDSDISRHRKRHEYATANCKYCNRPYYNIGNLKAHLKHEHHSDDIGIKINNSESDKREKVSRRCKERKKYDKLDVALDVALDESEYYKSDDNDKTEDKLKTKRRKTDHKCEGDNNDEGFCDAECKIVLTDDEKEDSKYEDGEENENCVDNWNKLRNYVTCSYEENNESSKREGVTQRFASKSNAQKKRQNFENMTMIKNTDNDTNDIDTRTSTFTKLSDGLKSPKNSKIMSCAFCDFSAASLKELQTHLDTHDYDIDLPASSDNEHVSVEDTSISLDEISLSESSVIVDNDNNMFLCKRNSETESDSGDTDTQCSTETEQYIGNEMENTKCVENIYENEVSSISRFDKGSNDSADALNTISNGVAKIESEFDDEFRHKPFACSKCLFKTGNLEHLKVHTEAHLYETKRTPYDVRKEVGVPVSSIFSDISHDKATQFSSDTCDTDTCINETGFSLDTQGNSYTEENDTNYVNRRKKLDSHDKYNTGDWTAHKDKKNVKSLIGRLSKENFKRRKKFYLKLSTSEGKSYECLICEKGNRFESKKDFRDHFWKEHRGLREKICNTCSYCSKPFPK